MVFYTQKAPFMTSYSTMEYGLSGSLGTIVTEQTKTSLVLLCTVDLKKVSSIRQCFPLDPI